jgi:hypothetical protein
MTACRHRCLCRPSYRRGVLRQYRQRRTARLHGGGPGGQRGRAHRGDVPVGRAQRAALRRSQTPWRDWSVVGWSRSAVMHGAASGGRKSCSPWIRSGLCEWLLVQRHSSRARQSCGHRLEPAIHPVTPAKAGKGARAFFCRRRGFPSKARRARTATRPHRCLFLSRSMKAKSPQVSDRRGAGSIPRGGVAARRIPPQSRPSYRISTAG